MCRGNFHHFRQSLVEESCQSEVWIVKAYGKRCGDPIEHYDAIRLESAHGENKHLDLSTSLLDLRSGRSVMANPIPRDRAYGYNGYYYETRFHELYSWILFKHGR